MNRFNDVNRHNIRQMMPALKLLIHKASFIALDTEFTGLGRGKDTKDPNIKDRYVALKQVVQTHALLAFGMSIFIETKKSYKVHNFNFSLLAQNSFMVCPKSLEFLVSNGFDFNSQYKNGIPYFAGEDQNLPHYRYDSNIHDPNNFIRTIFNQFVLNKSKIVVHNGLMDMMFMYQSFYAPLPDTLDTFVCDLSEMFGEIYDTKYCSEFESRDRSTFLAYLYRKSERLNDDKKLNNDSSFISVDIQKPIDMPLLPLVPLTEAITRKRKQDDSPVCSQYAAYGHCSAGKSCEKTHDLDLILDLHDGESLSANERKKLKLDVETRALEIVASRKNISADKNEETPIVEKSARMVSDQEQKQKTSFEVYHSAPFDAYMTAYIHVNQRKSCGNFSDTKNKLYIMGKDVPLIIAKSLYENPSEPHRLKMAAIHGKKD